MAHGIEIINGVVPAAYSNRSPWHHLANLIYDEGGQSGMDSDLAITASGLDGEYTMETMASTVDGTEMPGSFGVFYNHKRNGIRVGIGNVGTRYQLVQPRNVFSVMDQLVKDGILKYEAAFALQGYKKIVLLARMPSVDTFAPGDQGLRYIAASNDYTGDECLEFLPTSFRIQCANMKRMAWDIGRRQHLVWSIRHTGDMAEKMEKARQYLSQFDKKFSDFRDQAQVLATRRFTQAQAKEYINTLFPPIVRDGKEVKEGRAFTNRESKLVELRQAYKAPAQSLPSIKGTWWALFNSITDAVDHPARKFRGANQRIEEENRYLNVSGGPIADLKDEAFNLALSMAGVPATAA